MCFPVDRGSGRQNHPYSSCLARINPVKAVYLKLVGNTLQTGHQEELLVGTLNQSTSRLETANNVIDPMYQSTFISNAEMTKAKKRCTRCRQKNQKQEILKNKSQASLVKIPCCGHYHFMFCLFHLNKP